MTHQVAEVVTASPGVLSAFAWCDAWRLAYQRGCCRIPPSRVRLRGPRHAQLMGIDVDQFLNVLNGVLKKSLICSQASDFPALFCVVANGSAQLAIGLPRHTELGPTEEKLRLFAQKSIGSKIF